MLVFIIIGTSSCERDDICAEATQTTPHLVIEFYDINDPDVLKDVRQLSVRGFDRDDNPLDDITVESPFSSITLPLYFQNEGENVVSRFSIEKDTDFRLDSDPATESNVDIIEISYTPQFEYVSRACGYKSIFTNLSITVVQDGNNWILSNEVIFTTIENENEAHILLRH
ncbi:DUF6452 family protein [Subsaxibacter sp. CAU 1640]|uniref:DUF6452 family protein n=1 Tax=Subsaxibacter sp. CAU 1640 TaxID=2933271 RepID=UPI0020058F86|nr:DUF6452 family protein [Subsaxibacter sp. CAU 1640]MCK7590453.1 DUF6452 family protein [Subsaxibacter sp. CAU 1640]